MNSGAVRELAQVETVPRRFVMRREDDLENPMVLNTDEYWPLDKAEAEESADGQAWL